MYGLYLAYVRMYVAMMEHNSIFTIFSDLDVAEVYIRILTSLHFSEIHWLLTEMYGVGFDSCIDTQRWECAYQYGTMALKGYR